MDNTESKKDTRQLVAGAAYEMLAQGLARQINVRSIMARINYGSAGTISSALDDWWASLGDRVNSQSQTLQTLYGLPESISEALSDVLSSIAQHAQQQANARFASQEERAEQRVREAQQDAEFAEQARVATAREVERAQAHNQELQERIEVLTRIEQSERERAAKAERQLSESKQDLASARQEVASWQKKHEDVEAYAKGQIGFYAQRADDEKQARKELDTQYRKLTDAHDKLRATISEQEILMATLSADLNRLDKQNIHLQTENAALVKQQQKDAIALTQTNATLLSTQGELQRAYVDVNERKLEYAALQGEKSALEQELRRYIDANATLKQEIRGLSEKNAKKATRKRVAER